MAHNGPIIVVDDDLNDIDVVIAAITELGFKNPIRSFTGAKSAMDFLGSTTEVPFIILCDIRMVEMNGLEFRNAVNQNDYLRKKSIPFIFLTEAVSQEIVNIAYDLTVQGFILKPRTFDDLKSKLNTVLNYWTACVHRNSF